MSSSQNAALIGHTPTPWNQHRYYDGAIHAIERENGGEPFTDGAFVIARGDQIIGTIQFRAGKNIGWEHVSDPAEYRANLAFVLEAVNTFYELRARLAAAEAEVEGFKNNNRFHRGHSYGYEEAKREFGAELAKLRSELSLSESFHKVAVAERNAARSELELLREQLARSKG